jgi:transcriptional regulator with XRE-family HTH domain
MRLPPVTWLWTAPDAAAALRSRDLATIIRAYRRINGLSQEQLANQLGYDKTYISMIETGRRSINDLAGRRHIARALGLPAHVLGTTDSDDADFTAMLQFADSTIRLAESARRAGNAADAVTELWPLVSRLTERATAGLVERDTIVLIGQARMALGVSLGTVLPEQRLACAARWTGSALRIIERLGDRAMHAHALRMHGNELRKTGHTAAAIARLSQAVKVSSDDDELGAGHALLARAAGDQGNTTLFDDAIGRCHRLLDRGSARGDLFNPFTVREIHLRGLISTGRVSTAVRLMDAQQEDAPPAVPQWHVIERVTTGQLLIAAGSRESAGRVLREALITAERHRLPHQIQRAIRAAETGGLPDVSGEGRATLQRVCR